MRTTDTISHALCVTLQDVSDQLAAALARPVSIRESSAELRQDARERHSGSPAQVEVPVVDSAEVIAYIAIQTDGHAPLTASDYEALDAAASLVQGLLRDNATSSGVDRETIQRELLNEDPRARRAAYSRALQQRWLHREQGTVVRALLIDSAVTDVQSIAFARHLAHLRPVPLHFMALHAGMVMMVSQPADADSDDLIFHEASKRGIRILGIGTASPARGATDLRGAADEAAIAATLAAALPQFHPSVDASGLGGWLLLASAAADPAHLHIISPAAHALYTLGDESQRLTIETYLDVGANVVAACEVLFLHRTTLYYRLERMPEVVRDALHDGIKRSTLHVALKLIRLWEATGRV